MTMPPYVKVATRMLGLLLLFAASLPAVWAQEEAPSAPDQTLPAAPEAAPRLVCPEPVFDFGEKVNIDPVEHAYVVRNEGKGELIILKVKASCGCTAAVPEKKVLSPGEETRINVVLNLHNRVGNQKKTISVSSNDPENPQYTLTLKGVATSLITVEPGVLNLGTVTDDYPVSGSVRVSAARDDVVFKVLEVKATNAAQGWEATLAEVTPGKAYDVGLSVPGGLKPGYYTGQVQIFTDHPGYPRLQVTATMRVMGPYQVSPSKISLDMNKKIGEQTIRIAPFRMEDAYITEVVVPVDGIEYSIGPKRGTTSTLHLANIPVSKDLAGKEVIVRMDNAEYPEIKIPFLIRRNPTPGMRPTRRSNSAVEDRRIPPRPLSPAGPAKKPLPSRLRPPQPPKAVPEQ